MALAEKRNRMKTRTLEGCAKGRRRSGIEGFHLSIKTNNHFAPFPLSLPSSLHHRGRWHARPCRAIPVSVAACLPIACHTPAPRHTEKAKNGRRLSGINRRMIMINRQMIMINRRMIMSKRRMIMSKRRMIMINRRMIRINHRMIMSNHRMIMINRRMIMIKRRMPDDKWGIPDDPGLHCTGNQRQ